MDTEKFADEIFCLRYEMRLLSNLLIEGKTERWVEGCVYPNTHLEHIQRYEMLSRFTKDKQVLDLACGAGKGSYVLATDGAASSVTACDLDPEAIRYARARYAHSNVHHQVADGMKYVDPKRFDILACFETIEHVNDPERLLRNFAASLKSDGKLFISTPISERELDAQPSNPYHVQEWGFYAFQNLVSKIFRIERVYVQCQLLPQKQNVMLRARRKLDKLLRRGVSLSLASLAAPRPQLEEWDKSGLSLTGLGKQWYGFQVLVGTPLEREM